MVQYYYDKFNVVDQQVVKESYVGASSVTNGYPSYQINGTLFYSTGNYEYHTLGNLPVGRQIYESSNGSNSIMRYSFVTVNNVESYRLTVAPEPAKGTLLQSNITAEDGTYPANGKHTDGYWYVKGAAVGPLPPGTVINQPYSTAGNGGRKLVRLSNGWLVVATISSTNGIFVHVSKDGGITWSALTRMEQASSDVAIASNGTKVYILSSYTNNTSLRIYSFDATTVTNTNIVSSGINIDNGQQSFGNVSLAIDPTNGHLHAAWASKNATYPNSFNIRYAKSTDGGVTWSAVEQVTYYNQSADYTLTSPTIVTKNGHPLILADHSYGSTSKGILAFTTAFTDKAYSSFNASWGNKVVFSGGSYAQIYPSAIVDKDGVIHVAWSGSDSNSSVPKIRYSKSTDGGISWATQTPILNGLNPSITTDKNGQLFILFDTSASIGKLWLQSNNVWLNTYIKSNSDTNVSPSALYDAKFDSVFGDIPPLIHQVTGKSVQYLGSFKTNNAPTVTLTSPTNNQTLYENDILNISGEAYDADKDQSVTAYYQINSEPKKVLATNLSQTQIALSKQLTFRGGKLYDGDTALTGTLADGVVHTLKVWAEDSEKASSAIVERTFYVVPNRAPLLSVDAVVPSGVVDADKFKISGTVSDQDANSTVKVTRRINTGNAIEIYSGTGGAWEFELALSQLVVGQNTIVIEVVDNYGAKTSKTVTLNKKEVKTPILQSVARYKITPPAGSAKGVLLFIERDEALNLKVELSMTLSGEQEQYETLTASNTAPMPNTNNIVEDTYYHEKTEPKDNIILKLSTTRPDATVNHKIHLISGAVE